MRRVVLWLPVVLYMAAIFFVSGQTNPPMPASVSDKLLHAVAYFGLALLVLFAAQEGRPGPLTAIDAVVALLVSIGYGVTDELHQLFVPGRSADARDLLADAAGAATALAGWWAILGTPSSQAPTPKSQA